MKLFKKLFFIIVMLNIVSCGPDNFSISDEEVTENMVIAETGKILQKTKNLEFMGVMHGRNNDEEWVKGFTTKTPKQLTMNEARELIIYVSELFLCNINNSSILRPYLNPFPQTVKYIEIGILFIKEKGGFISSPNIAVTDFIEGRIIYRLDENDLLHTIHKETYEEAVQILKDQGKYDQIMKEVHEVCNKE